MPLESGATLEWKRDDNKPGTLRISKVEKNSEAAQLGYAKGDEIIAAGSEPLGENGLSSFLRLASDAPSLRVRRKKQEMDLPPLFRAAGIIEGTDEHGIKPGQSLPPIAAKTWSGEEFNLESLAGKVVLINFWASWCAPCMEELPELIKLYERYSKQGLVVLAINIDDDPAAGRKALQSGEPSFIILHDSGFGSRTASRYRVTSIPLSLLIDREGVIRQVCRGYSPTGLVDDLRKPLELLLAGRTPLINIVRPR